VDIENWPEQARQLEHIGNVQIRIAKDMRSIHERWERASDEGREALRREGKAVVRTLRAELANFDREVQDW
jgi:hypothetical protein